MKYILFHSLLFSILFFAASHKAAPGNDIAEDVLTYTNEFRTSKGLNSLSQNKVLDKLAQQHSEDMAAGKVKFGHDGFAKRNALAQKQLPIQYFAENVAYGVNTGQDVVNLWKNSDGHRKNMLGKYKQIGIGVAKDKKGRIFYTQVFSD